MRVVFVGNICLYAKWNMVWWWDVFLNEKIPLDPPLKKGEAYSFT